MKTMIKRILQAAKRWLEDDQQKGRGNAEMERRRFGKFANGELNVNLLQILERTGEMARPN